MKRILLLSSTPAVRQISLFQAFVESHSNLTAGRECFLVFLDTFTVVEVISFYWIINIPALFIIYNWFQRSDVIKISFVVTFCTLFPVQQFVTSHARAHVYYIVCSGNIPVIRVEVNRRYYLILIVHLCGGYCGRWC